MIYIEFNEDFLDEHKIYTQENGSLKGGLNKLKQTTLNHKAIRIIDFILSNLDDIVCCNFEGLIRIQKQYIDFIYNLGQFDDNDLDTFKILHNEFSKLFITAYDNFTDKNLSSKWNSYIYLKKLNQSVCPYCNANFIQSIQASKILVGSGSRALPDLDHFLPKSLYPIFAITLSNLIPSCIFCNQRFKGAFETNLTYFFSPFDKNIKDSFRFKINYSNGVTNAFDKIQSFNNSLSAAEIFYFNLISKIKILSGIDKKIEEILDGLDYYVNDVEQEVNNLQNIISSNRQLLEHKNIAEVNDKLDGLLDKAENYGLTLKEVNILDRSVVLSKIQYHFKKILNDINEFQKLYEELLGYKGIKNINEVKKPLTYFKNYLLRFKSKINKIISFDYKESNDYGNFVENVLGVSTNYKIEVEANESLTEENRMKVYYNSALFQLEVVYNQFKPYLNRKIKQSYIVNRLYLEQLNNQFPGLFTEQQVDSAIDTMLIDYENVGNEVLGKLLYDVLLPTIKEQHHINSLKLLDLD